MFLKIAKMFDWMGSSNSAFYMTLSGKGKNSQQKKKTIYILAKEGDGPNIPCVPAIILAKKIAKQQELKSGAFPCVGIIGLESYMDELGGLHIRLLEF